MRGRENDLLKRLFADGALDDEALNAVSGGFDVSVNVQTGIHCGSRPKKEERPDATLSDIAHNHNRGDGGLSFSL